MQSDAGSIGGVAGTASGGQARWLGSGIAGTAALALTGAHIALNRLTLQQTSPLAPLESLFTVALVLGMLTLAWAIGSRLLRPTTVVWHNAAERAVFSMALGLGVVAYTVMALAFCRLLSAPLLLALAAVAPAQTQQAMAALQQFQQQYLTGVFRDAALHVYCLAAARGNA
jgi:hypothetical protein